MPRKETSRTEWYRLGIIVILGAVLAACNPEGQAQEIKPAVIQSSDGLALNTEVVLQEGEEIIVETATPAATATSTTTNTPENTATSTATPTPTETATPEPTATPEAPEFPSDLVINEDLRFDREYPMTEYNQGYKTKQWFIIIRKQDLHLDEPFTLKDGRFHVQAWADAWFMDKEGKGYHLSIPLMIFDTERFQAAGYFNGIWQFIDGEYEDEERLKEVITKDFTGPINENTYYTGLDLENTVWCFTETQFRNCGEGNRYPIFMETGYIPSADIDMTSRKWDPIRIYLEFHRELLADIYTQENVEAFWQDPDFNPRSLQFADPNVPVNFFVPFAMPTSVKPYK